MWRVLLELLSCHAVTSPSVSVASCSDPNSCYKSVDTPTGPRLVISVSKTYIRLKELILEKKHVEKEMNRMKQLNIHLESKLSEQVNIFSFLLALRYIYVLIKNNIISFLHTNQYNRKKGYLWYQPS